MDVDDGIVVDDLGRTSRPGIFAAGDCSTRRIGGVAKRDEDLASARASGIRAATGVLVDAGAVDEPAAARPAPPRRWSNQCGLRVTTVGAVTDADLALDAAANAESATPAEHVVVASDEERHESVVVRDGIVVGAVAIAARPDPRGIVAMVGKPWNG